MTPEPVRRERTGNGSARTRFQPKNPGRPKGTKDKRRIAGTATAKARGAKAWDVVAALLTCASWRARLEASKTVLAYSIGLPRQTLELTGGFGDLAGELAQALAEVRSRRALPGAVAVLEVEPTALEAPVVDVEPIETPASVPVAPVQPEETP